MLFAYCSFLLLFCYCFLNVDYAEPFRRYMLFVTQHLNIQTNSSVDPFTAQTYSISTIIDNVKRFDRFDASWDTKQHSYNRLMLDECGKITACSFLRLILMMNICTMLSITCLPNNLLIDQIVLALFQNTYTRY